VLGVAVTIGLNRVARREGTITIRNAGGWLALGVLAGSILWGFTYPVEAAAKYQFNALAGVPDGWYSRLGESPSFLFLKSCSDGRVVAVQVALVSSSELQRHADYAHRLDGPSLVDVILNGKAIYVGPEYSCPTP
jgi:hypothetical protein